MLDIVPTIEQFESMRHVDMNIPIAIYRQPFPSMVVQVPSESRIAIAQEAGIAADECPR